ncbi:MAG: 16S rRNA (adenine(1518)-N(6)/adenine(1519)-N(6))-dimethyltransferase RsmA [Thermodesulfobacteriota bacterium]|nr:16S rRNA (adenine(1518)-N(6)/adenine(1519)-N(6))-dimethyltransferase RsmA [Thermodesulfobacteriota bacterium]
MAHAGSLKAGPGFRPRKRLGQHFLVDHKIIQKTIARAGFRVFDLVLEIGPGQGALTLPLARTVGHVVAVEKDPDLANLLKKKLSRSGITNVTLVNHDILQWDFHEVKPLSSSRIQVIGNLPYNITSPFLEKLIDNRDVVARAVLMFQLEVAKRLIALSGGKTYGALTLFIQYHAQCTVLFEVPRTAFFPRPKVDSMVLELDFERPYPRRAEREASFKKVVRAAFSHRRKTLLNSLAGFCPSWDREVLLEDINRCGIDPKRRAETLDMDEFLCLEAALKLTSG